MPVQSYHIASMQGIGTRRKQEDSFCSVNACDVKAIREKGLFFAVCDGMGGMRDGKEASEIATKYLTSAFQNFYYDKNISAQIKQAVYEASLAVLDKLEGQGGSTAIACLIYQDALYFASVGDSYLYIKRGQNLIRLNVEHNLKNKMYQEAIEYGELDPEPARVHPESAALTAFLGMPDLAEVDGSVRPMKLNPGDIIIAASDGVGGTLTDEEILEAISMQTPEFMCNKLKEQVEAYRKENQDNFTATVVKCVL